MESMEGQRPKEPPQIVKRYELAPGDVKALGGSANIPYEAGGGVLLYNDGSYKLEITLRAFGSQRVVDTDITNLAGPKLEKVLSILRIDKQLKPLQK